MSTRYFKAFTLGKITTLQLMTGLMLCITSSVSYGQVLDFEVFVENKSAGNMKVTKSNFVNGGMIIDVNAKFNVEMLGTSKLFWYSTSYYKKNILTDSESVLERNRQVREQCMVKGLKTGYQIERKNEKLIMLPAVINFSLNLMYYSEPKGKSRAFSERFGDFCEIKEIGNGIYEVSLPAGNYIRYYYENGICVMTQNLGSLQEMTMKLKKQ